MQVGIVAEGWSDFEVLRNILKGWLGLDGYKVSPIQPKLALDETDLAAARQAGYQQPSAAQFSNWQLVIETCRQRETIRQFLHAPTADDRLVVVQLDTDTADEPDYGVTRPDRTNPDYVTLLRDRVAAMLAVHLGELAPSVRFAVTVEETEAWVLLLHERDDRPERLVDPKKQLARVQSPRGKKWPTDLRERLAMQSEGFRKGKTLRQCQERSASLRLFLASLPGETESGVVPSSALALT